MERWEEFNSMREDIPKTSWEASVFLFNVTRHLWNEKNHGEAVDIVIDAWSAVNREISHELR